MDGASIAFITIAVVDIPLFIFIGKLFFGCWSDFWEAIVFWVKPDLWSAIDGSLTKDWWAEIKLGLFGFTCGAIVWGELWVIVKLFGHLATT
jgi:hypothetical protein